MKLGERVKKARQDARMTQKDLAKAAGVSQARVSAIEIGYTKNPTCVVSIANVLKICPTWLLTGKKANKAPTDLLYELIQSLSEDQKLKEINYLERLIEENKL